jgi:phage terminase large subunit-like protein
MNRKGGAGSAPSISPSTGNVVIEPKKGRPTKDDIRRQKMDLADAAIVALVSNKPTKAKIREYFEGRIAHLNAEKR